MVDKAQGDGLVLYILLQRTNLPVNLCIKKQAKVTVLLSISVLEPLNHAWTIAEVTTRLLRLNDFVFEASMDNVNLFKVGVSGHAELHSHRSSSPCVQYIHCCLSIVALCSVLCRYCGTVKEVEYPRRCVHYTHQWCVWPMVIVLLPSLSCS